MGVIINGVSAFRPTSGQHELPQPVAVNIGALKQAFRQRAEARGIDPETGTTSVFEAIRIRGEMEKARRQDAVDSAPWRWIAARVGIKRMLAIWGAERWTEKIDHPEFGASTRIRVGVGMLDRVQSMPCEDAALARIHEQAVLYGKVGRLTISALEDRVLRLEREYLQRCQTDEFRRYWPTYAQGRYVVKWQADPKETIMEENTMDERKVVGWVSRQTGLATEEVKRCLGNVQMVAGLRAAMDMDGLPVEDEAFGMVVYAAA